jgi:GNAT superfamily N-acetyltransferase
VSRTHDVVIRAGRDDDGDCFIALIGACWSEYPSIILDIDGEAPELRALASHFADNGGALWAAESSGQIVGMIATYPEDGRTWAISRMYLLRKWRGCGLADRLLESAEAHALVRGAERLALWSDTRFERAHRFYERHGYRRIGPTRALNDRSNSVEFRYEKPVRSRSDLHDFG